MLHANRTQTLGHYENTRGEVGYLLISDGFKTIRIFEVADYAQKLEVSPDTIRRRIKEGGLIGIKVGRVWYVQDVEFNLAGQPLDKFPF